MNFKKSPKKNWKQNNNDDDNDNNNDNNDNDDEETNFSLRISLHLQSWWPGRPTAP